MNRNNGREESKIPKLDLDEFTFTPPGPMGLGLEEYIRDQQGSLSVKNKNLNGQKFTHTNFGSLLEYPLRKNSVSLQFNATDKIQQSENEALTEEKEHINFENQSFTFENTESFSESLSDETAPPANSIKIIIMEQNSLPWLSSNI